MKRSRKDFNISSILNNSSEKYSYLNKYSGGSVAVAQVAQPSEAGYANFMSKTFLWMFFGLSLTFAVALFMIFKSVSLVNFLERNLELYIFISVLSVLLIVLFGVFIDEITPLVGKIVFVVYSLMVGIVITFAITAVIYLLMATIGLLSKKDMSSIGKIIPFAIVGIILYLAVSVFLKSTFIDTIMGILCIIIFMTFTAYDSSLLRKFYFSLKGDEKMLEKASVVCALQLYLDYVLLFLVLLMFIGRRRK